MSFCISVSFAAVYLQGIGYSNSRRGLILALGSVTGIIMAISLADWIDRDERITAKKLIPWILALQTAAVGILLLIREDCFAVSAAFVAYIGFCTTVNNLNLKLYADADHAGFMLFTRFVTDDKKAAPFGERNSTLAAFLKKNPRYSLLLTGVVLLFFGHSIACNFLINLTRHVGGGTADMGFITAFKGLVEIPVMFLYARIFKEGKHSLALRITAAAFVLKTLVFILAGSVWQLTAAFILQAPSYALYMAAVVAYVKENIGYEDSAKAQSLAFTTTTFGGMLASLIGGRLYDSLSVTSTLWIAFAAGAAGTCIMFMGTRKLRTA